MPYNLTPVKIANGAVLPQSLCSSFTETYEYPILATTYNDGSYEASLIVDGVEPAALSPHLRADKPAHYGATRDSLGFLADRD